MSRDMLPSRFDCLCELKVRYFLFCDYRAKLIFKTDYVHITTPNEWNVLYIWSLGFVLDCIYMVQLCSNLEF